MEFFEEKIAKLSSLIKEASNIVVTTHERPDGDAIGSSSGIAHYLQLFKDKFISIVREDSAQTLSFIDNIFHNYTDTDAELLIAKADLIICTDFCSLSRAGSIIHPLLKQAKAKKVLIDHHVNPEEEDFDLVFSETEISSASELVYKIIKALVRFSFESSEEKILKQLFGGPCGFTLMCGMTTDTNNFSNSTYASTLQMASELLGYGVDRDYIVQAIQNSYRENRVEAFAHILSNELSIRPDGIAIIKVSLEDWHRFGLLEGELEGLVNIPLTIEKVKICIYLRETEDRIRVSLRSKKGWSARDLALKYFNGGGHENASGGKLVFKEHIDNWSLIDSYLEKIELQ